MRLVFLRLLVTALCGLLLGAAPLAAQPAAPSAARTGDALTVVLLTMGPGDAVWEKFGHNALWIHDPVQGTDRVYNYGVFDFHSPGYWGRFVKGTWVYQLAVADIRETMWQYQYLNRTVVAQELNLTGRQKADLQAFLEWNARPENREYVYDYFRDNCSTRIRDVLDRVVGGQLRAATEDSLTATTYRWHSRRLLAGEPVVYTGLEAGLGPSADRPISAWEEMFLPEKLEQQAQRLSVRGAEGAPVPLVASRRVMYQAVGRGAERTAPPGWVPVYLMIGGVLGAMLLGLGRLAPRSAAARHGFALLAALTSLLVGVAGALLVGLWGFTNHVIAHRNENLFHFDPLALALVVLVPALAYGAGWAARPARAVALAVAALSLLGALLQLLPGLDQVNGEIIALLLPVHLALAAAVHRLARDRAGAGRGGAGTHPAATAARTPSRIG